MLSTLISLNADIIKIYIHIMNHTQLYIDHQQLKSVCLLNKCIGHYKKGTKNFCAWSSFSNYATEHYINMGDH